MAAPGQLAANGQQGLGCPPSAPRRPARASVAAACRRPLESGLPALPSVVASPRPGGGARAAGAACGGCGGFEASLAPSLFRPSPRPRSVRAPAAATDDRGLYPASDITESGFLQASPLHRVWFECHGARDGIPALFLHGGPGAACWPNHARFFDPKVYRVVLMDQRGCGRSQPRGCLAENTTAALVHDIERLRLHLGVDRWLLLGGSWGVTLSLAYALAHPNRVAGIILRGVCTMTHKEIDWVFGASANGAAMIKPWGWHAFLDHLDTAEERAAPLQAYYRRLLRRDTRDQAAQAWMSWEGAVGFNSGKQAPGTSVWDGSTRSWHTPQPGAPPAPTVAPRLPLAAPPAPPPPARPAPDARHAGEWPPGSEQERQGLLEAGLAYRGDAAMSASAAQALLEAHYCMHAAFLPPPPAALLDAIAGAAADGTVDAAGAKASTATARPLAHIPCIAVQGADDLCTPPATAYALHRAWPEAQLRLVPGAGHSMYDPRITAELVAATDAFAALLSGQRAGAAEGAEAPEVVALGW